MRRALNQSTGARVRAELSRRAHDCPRRDERPGGPPRAHVTLAQKITGAGERGTYSRDTLKMEWPSFTADSCGWGEVTVKAGRLWPWWAEHLSQLTAQHRGTLIRFHPPRQDVTHWVMAGLGLDKAFTEKPAQPGLESILENPPALQTRCIISQPVDSPSSFCPPSPRLYKGTSPEASISISFYSTGFPHQLRHRHCPRKSTRTTMGLNGVETFQSPLEWLPSVPRREAVSPPRSLSPPLFPRQESVSLPTPSPLPIGSFFSELSARPTSPLAAPPSPR